MVEGNKKSQKFLLARIKHKIVFVSLEKKTDGEILTWPALVPHEEVFGCFRARIYAKQPAADKEPATPSVLALIQHLLQQGMHTNMEQKRGCASVSP